MSTGTPTPASLPLPLGPRPPHPMGSPASQGPRPTPVTSKGSPSTSGKTLDTSSWPQWPPWKVLATMVALENRGLMWKTMSPVSDRKLISNLGAS